MVKFYDAGLDRIFAALADPTRRALLTQLNELDEQESLSVSELARPFPVSLPAVMKHLDVLSDAGLITRVKTGRTVACQLAAAPMEEAMSWLNRYQRFWSERLDRLATFLEEDSCPPNQTLPASQTVQMSQPLPTNLVLPTDQASPSSAGSTRRRRRSTTPGRMRKR